MHGNDVGGNEKRTSTERGENGSGGFGACKERSYRGKETEANRPNAVSRFCSAAGTTTDSSRPRCKCNRCRQRGAISSFSATATTSCRWFSRRVCLSLGNCHLCWKCELFAGATNANGGGGCKRSCGIASLPGSNDAICFWRWKLWPKSRRNAVLGEPLRRFSSRHELCRITSVTLWAITADFANEKFVRAKTARSCGESSRCRSVSSCVR
mmetsp:Transcript_3986/g.12263  ORF Transcript_3986/g.12263 Transcript_3986/m.12263 type:complete len:211 (+) Transcript_3986:463-1095(+)